MKWKIDDHGRLIITVTRREQRSLQAAQRRDEKGRCDPTFDSDDFMRQLFEPIVTNDEYTWLPDGCTDDLTSAPMLALLGEEMPGPDDPQDAVGMGLVHIGRWTHEGRLRQMYQPVLRRWAFMNYQIISPQRDLAETGVCTWDGGDLWGTDDAAKKALAEFAGQEITSRS
jgi:hypothetical protein